MTSVTIAQADLTLLLDLEGVIQQATLSEQVADEGLREWVGRPWFETVDDRAGDKVRRIVEDARRSGVSAFRQLNQRFPSGLELPMEFTTVRLGGKAGMIAIGRNLQAVTDMQSRLVAAQHAREQDYWKLREVETRYRSLFDATHEPVLVLTGDTLRVVEANPAAIRAFGFAPGWEFLSEIAPQDLDAFRNMLQRVREQGRTPGILVHLGPDRAPWVARASLLTSEPGSVFLLQIALVPAVQPVAPVPGPVSLDQLIDRLPDGFVTFDASGVIRRANGAFLDLVQVGAEGAVVGQTLGRWLTLPGADLAVLIGSVQRHRQVRMFTSRLIGELGGETEIEICAAGSSDNAPRLIAAVIRDIGRRPAPPAEEMSPASKRLGEQLNEIAENVGNTPLLQLVRDTTSVVERHYIDAALEMAGGNRTAAAELLGLSRQSLYVKLGRYAIDGALQVASERSD